MFQNIEKLIGESSDAVCVLGFKQTNKQTTLCLGELQLFVCAFLKGITSRHHTNTHNNKNETNIYFAILKWARKKNDAQRQQCEREFDSKRQRYTAVFLENSYFSLIYLFILCDFCYCCCYCCYLTRIILVLLDC